MKKPMRLFQRENGVYYVEVARNRWKSLKTRNLETAEALFEEMEKEYLRGRLIILENEKQISLGKFTEAYIESRDGISPHTIRKDKLSLDLLADVVGKSIQIRALTEERIEEFKKACKARKASEITIDGYLRHIKAALSYAVEKGYIKKKPKVKMYRKDDQDLPRIILPDDIRKILAKAQEKDVELWRLFTFYIWTGARRREGLGLEWPRINLERNFCRVRGKGGRERVIPLLGPIIEALEPVRKDIGRVFPDWHPDTVSHRFREIATDCGVNARLHDLRHSAVSYMLASGIPIQVVAQIAGHRQLATTKIYTHILENVLIQEMQKMKIE
jgi:site-specific recombinase XerD